MPILLVSHYLNEEGWAFLAGKAFSVEDGQIVALKNIIALDPTVEEIAGLPPGWSAIRQFVGDEWRSFEDPELCEDDTPN